MCNCSTTLLKLNVLTFIGKTICELQHLVFSALLDDDKLVVSELDRGRLSVLKLS